MRVNMTLTSVLRHARSIHAECDFHTHSDFDKCECDYDTHDCDFNTLKSDFYTQSVILTRNECDYDTHECDYDKHEYDLYTHELNFNTMRVTLT
jgi:hypothetical protein